VQVLDQVAVPPGGDYFWRLWNTRGWFGFGAQCLWSYSGFAGREIGELVLSSSTTEYSTASRIWNWRSTERVENFVINPEIDNVSIVIEPDVVRGTVFTPRKSRPFDLFEACVRVIRNEEQSSRVVPDHDPVLRIRVASNDSGEATAPAHIGRNRSALNTGIDN
jgi:hypothetical protein